MSSDRSTGPTSEMNVDAADESRAAEGNGIGGTRDAGKQDNGSSDTKAGYVRPVLLSIGGPRTRKLSSSRTSRQNVNGIETDEGGDASKSLQLWQKLQEERDLHQLSRQREEQLQGKLKTLQESLEQYGKGDVEVLRKQYDLDIEKLSVELSSSQRLLHEANQRFNLQELQLSQQNLLLEKQSDTLAKQSEEIQQHLHQIESLEQNDGLVHTNLTTLELRLREFQQKCDNQLGLIKNYESEIKEKDEKLQAERRSKISIEQCFELVLREKDKTIVSKDARIHEMQMAQEEQIKQRIALEEILQKQVETVNGQEHKLVLIEMEKKIETSDKQLKELEKYSLNSENKLLDIIKGMQENVTLLEYQLEQKEQLLDGMKEKLVNSNSELEAKNIRLQLIEENASTSEEDMTRQVQGQINLNETLKEIVEQKDEEIKSLYDQLNQQRTDLEESVEKFQLFDMLHEEELKVKNDEISKRAMEVSYLEQLKNTINADCEKLEKENISMKEELEGSQDKLVVKDEHIKTLIKLCQYLLHDQESILKHQYILQTRIQEQLLQLGEYEDDIYKKSEKLEENMKLASELGKREQEIQVLEKELEKNKLDLLDVMENFKQTCYQKQSVDGEVNSLNELINALKTKTLELLEQIQDRNQKMYEYDVQLSEKNKELQDIRVVIEKQLFEKYDQAKQIEDLESSLEEKLKELQHLNETLQKQDKCIQRLQQQIVQLEQDMQVQQQEALKQQQDSIEEHLLQKEVLEEQLEKQNVLLHEQDLRLHEYDEHVQHLHKANKFYSWGLKKK